MARLDTTFDATSVEPSQPFEVIPAGKYPVHIVASDLKPTSNGAGQYIWLELDILDGEYKGRKIWDRLNVINPNPQAVEIAQRALSALCHACGVMAFTDTEELHWKPILATVRVRPPKGDYAASNEIRGYSPIGGTVPAASAAANAPQNQSAPAPAAPTATPASSSPPWRKRAS